MSEGPGSQGRRLNGTFTMSGMSGSGSDTSIGALSVDTINEEPESEVMTPSSSAAFLTIPLPIIFDPTTPTSAHSMLFEEVTPKAPLRAEAKDSEGARKGGIVRPARDDREKGKEKKVERKKSRWTFMPDVGTMGSML
jgi:hypothetical protein